MSINTIGEINKNKINISTVHGSQGYHGDVTVDVTGYINRNTKASVLQKYLKSGWDWNKYTPVIVAKFPDGKEKLLDGDHRRHMYRTVFPQERTMPAYFIEVENKAEYHRLFHAINWSARANASASEVFVHQYHGEDPDAVKIVYALSQCGLCVHGSDDTGGKVGNPSGMSVSIVSFHKSLKAYDGFGTEAYRGPYYVKMAAEAYRRAWPLSDKEAQMRSELFGALSLVYSLYPELYAGNAIQKDWENWFENTLSSQTPKLKATSWKLLGGKVHHKEFQSIALGMLKEFQDTTGQTKASYKKSKLKQDLIKFD